MIFQWLDGWTQKDLVSLVGRYGPGDPFFFRELATKINKKVGVSNNGGTPKWMVYEERSH